MASEAKGYKFDPRRLHANISGKFKIQVSSFGADSGNKVRRAAASVSERRPSDDLVDQRLTGFKGGEIRQEMFHQTNFFFVVCAGDMRRDVTTRRGPKWMLRR